LTQIPNVIGLLVCEQAIVEEKTRNVTLVNCFTALKAEAFPSEPKKFTVFALFSDGVGELSLDVVICRLDNG
jgi:hypothetical protein